jgi:hypothetical protein
LVELVDLGNLECPTEVHFSSPSLNSHGIMVNLQLGCDPNMDIFSDPRCNWIHEYYYLPHNDQESFWSFIGNDSHYGLISPFLLKSFE